ncbi:MAG: LCP family protein [Solirubrobacterales bacterium]|nr:LCP family protein [Solirubrobacterales bacterium]MBV9534253.1 LCP family protein [Solirubrobacterales bacterium]
MTLIPTTKRGSLGRFTLGAVIVVLFTAATTAVAGLMEFKNIAADLSRTPALKRAQVSIASPGSPQTILVIGSDHRAGTPWNTSNTDTMMLIRLNPSSSTINVLSVPRDLRVQIPAKGGSFTSRINAAYSIGGPNLLIRIMRQQVFPGLTVNHIVDINFGGFRALVNAIGCVYSDVDHRYYNNTALTDYSSVNIQPGYQKLCGSKALAFVRFRHTDSDLVRTARQQDFIRWAKDQYPQSSLISNRDRLLRIFGSYTQTDHDLHTVDGLINLFNLIVFMDGHTIKQIRFPAQFLPCNPACYLGATAAAERRAFRQLMTPTQSHPSGSSPAAHGSGHGRHVRSRPDVFPDPSGGERQAAALGKVGLPVYYPRVIASSSSYCYQDYNSNCYLEVPSPGSYPRKYTIADRLGHNYRAYRMTLLSNPLLGQYYGIQGMQWQNPPLLASPSFTRTVDGKKLQVFTGGGKVTQVAWHTPRGVYWVSNTLTNSLSAQQMIAIAASFTRAG